MIVYALYHPTSGQYMPEIKSGYSWWDPIKYPKKEILPRLFPSELSALRAKIAWEAGPWSKVRTTEGSWEEGYYETDNAPAPRKCAETTPRTKNELKIISILLEETAQ